MRYLKGKGGRMLWAVMAASTYNCDSCCEGKCSPAASPRFKAHNDK